MFVNITKHVYLCTYTTNSNEHMTNNETLGIFIYADFRDVVTADESWSQVDKQTRKNIRI